MKMKARTTVGRGMKSLLCDHGSELRLGRENKNIKSAKIIDGMSKVKNENKNNQ